MRKGTTNRRMLSEGTAQCSAQIHGPVDGFLNLGRFRWNRIATVFINVGQDAEVNLNVRRVPSGTRVNLNVVLGVSIAA